MDLSTVLLHCRINVDGEVKEKEIKRQKFGEICVEGMFKTRNPFGVFQQTVSL